MVHILNNNNRLLTEREGRTGEYWPEVVAVRTKQSEVRTATTEAQYSPVRPKQARLVSLLYGTLFPIVKCNGTLFPIVWHSVSDGKMHFQKRFETESDKSSCWKLEKGFLVDQTIFSWLQNMDQVSVKWSCEN